MAQREEFEMNVAGSEEAELSISQIHGKIDRFTEMISELLDSGKAMFKKISDEYEERLIMIHKEQMEKWQEEIRELRAIDVRRLVLCCIMLHICFRIVMLIHVALSLIDLQTMVGLTKRY